MSKQRVIIYSNCHGDSIRTLLIANTNFTDRYYIELYIVHKITLDQAVALFSSICPDDIVIYQYITDEYRGGGFGSSRIPKSCRHIRLTNAYYQGYHPNFGYLYQNQDDKIIQDGMELYDLTLFYRWLWKIGGLKDRRIEYCSYDIFPILDPSFFKLGYSLQEHHLSLAKLRWRDDLFNADIRVADYIEKNFRRTRLFHTMNHPTLILFDEEVRQLSQFLGIQHVQTNQPDPMDFLIMPIYSSTAKNLSLEFDCKPVYRYNNIDYTPEQFESKTYAAIDKIDGSIRDYNLKIQHDKKINFW
jgi:hypothetical protein